jgi:hypothetical protein
VQWTRFGGSGNDECEVIADGGLSHSQSLVPCLLLLLKKKNRRHKPRSRTSTLAFGLANFSGFCHTHSLTAMLQACTSAATSTSNRSKSHFFLTPTHTHTTVESARRAALATGGPSRDVHATESGVLKVPHELWPRGHTSRLDLGPHRDLVVSADATHTHTRVCVRPRQHFKGIELLTPK